MKKYIIGAILITLPLTAYTCMIIVAYSHNAGPIETQAYERSKQFDQEKFERKKFVELGLALECKTSNNTCRFSIQGAQHAIVGGDLVFKRPSNAADDFSLKWNSSESIQLAQFPLKGRWYVEFKGLHGEDPVRTQTEIYVP